MTEPKLIKIEALDVAPPSGSLETVALTGPSRTGPSAVDRIRSLFCRSKPGPEAVAGAARGAGTYG